MTTYCNRHGDTVTVDEALDAAGNLRNGFGLRIPLQMCDSLQRSVAEDAKRRSKTLHRDPMGRELGTSEEEEEEEPRRRSKCDAATGFTDSRGVFFAADQRMAAAQSVVDHMAGRDEILRQRYRDSRAETDKARREMIDGMRRDAKPPVGAYPYSAAAEGGECTVNGESGTLQRRGDALVCVTRRQSAPHTDALPRTMTASDAQKIKDEAYQAMCAELTRGRSNG